MKNHITCYWRSCAFLVLLTASYLAMKNAPTTEGGFPPQVPLEYLLAFLLGALGYALYMWELLALYNALEERWNGSLPEMTFIKKLRRILWAPGVMALSLVTAARPYHLPFFFVMSVEVLAASVLIGSTWARLQLTRPPV